MLKKVFLYFIFFFLFTSYNLCFSNTLPDIFYNLEYIRKDSSSSLSLTTQNKLGEILELSSSLYKKSNNKFRLLSQIRQFFLLCEKGKDKKEIKEICSAMLDDWIGRGSIKSNITVDEIIKNISSGFSLFQRRDYSDFLEHYPPLNLYSIIPVGEFIIGEYLFGEVFIENEDFNYAGLRLLKAGDTHRQEFMRINHDPNIHIVRLSGYVEKNDLLLDIAIQYNNSNLEAELHKIVETYVLNKDGEWVLHGCYDALYEDTSAFYLVSKEEKTLNVCNDYRLDLKTLI